MVEIRNLACLCSCKRLDRVTDDAGVVMDLSHCLKSKELGACSAGHGPFVGSPLARTLVVHC